MHGAIWERFFPDVFITPKSLEFEEEDDCEISGVEKQQQDKHEKHLSCFPGSNKGSRSVIRRWFEHSTHDFSDEARPRVEFSSVSNHYFLVDPLSCTLQKHATRKETKEYKSGTLKILLFEQNRNICIRERRHRLAGTSFNGHGCMREPVLKDKTQTQKQDFKTVSVKTPPLAHSYL